MEKKDKIVLGIGLFAMVLTIIIGTSYAYWKLSKVQEDQNIIATGCFNVEFTEGDAINLQDAYPISDEEGLKLTPYTFTIKNTCDDWSAYQINLETLEQEAGVKVLPDEYVRVDLQEKRSLINTTLTSDIETETTLDNATKAYKLYEGMLKSQEEKIYNLRIWMDKDTPPAEETMNAFYSGKVTIEMSYNKNVMKNAGTLRTTSYSDKTAFYNYRSNITKVVFQNELKPIETDLTWDVSEAQDGSVMSYLIPNEDDPTKYTLYLQGDGGIYANPNCSSLFDSFTNLTVIEELKYLDTSKVTDMSYMFYDCNKLTSIDLSNFDTSNVTDMVCMFTNCYKLTSLDLSNFDTSKVTNMRSMFNFCNHLTSLDLSNFDTSNVTTMSYMFKKCSSLTSLDVSNFNTSNVTIITEMFMGCEKIENLNLSSFDTSNVKSLAKMFSGCSSFTNLNLSNFDTSNVTTMEQMFSDCSSLTSINLSNFDTTNVTSMSSMFYNCNKLTSINLSGFDTSNVTTMKYMFGKCSSLIDLDLSNFNTSKVTNMYGMFYECNNLTSLILSNFDTSKVTDMSYMFYDCQKINTVIDILSSNINSYSSMFLFAAKTAGAQITVNYTSENGSLVDQMIATKIENDNVVKGSLIS